jgi:hypothetical protein
MARDCIVEVRWTGDADVDISIEEPAGTICSVHNPQSAGGGVLLGDGYSSGRTEEDGQVTETYVCPQGFSGVYRLHVRRMWGNVSTGHVTVNILTDVGRPSQRLIQQQIPLTEQNALISFNVQDGRRQTEMAAAQLEQLQDVQNQLNGAILAQVGNGEGNNIGLFPGIPGGINGTGGSDPSDLLRDLYRASRLGRGRGFNRGGGVGFMPQIETFPAGANMQVMGVISGDRRYVRISPAPSFFGIGDVQTFNFVTGEGGQTGGGGLGGFGGGGAGGAGGGLGGAGGGGGVL